MIRVLMVCTANQCRSPMAAALAAHQLHRRGVEAEVSSCGMLEGGHPATRRAVDAVGRRGLDLHEHVSRQIDADLVAGADLVVTMERRHLLQVAQIDLDAVGRSFTLPELAALARAAGLRPPDQPFDRWLAHVDAYRDRSQVLVYDDRDDIPDPMGGPRRGYRRAVEQIDELLGDVFDFAFPGTGEAVTPRR